MMDYRREYENLLEINAKLSKCLEHREEQILTLEAQLVECRDNHQPAAAATCNQKLGQPDVDDNNNDAHPVYVYKLIKKHPNNCGEKYPLMFVRWRSSRVLLAQQSARHRFPLMKVVLEIGCSKKEINFAAEVAHVLGAQKIKTCYNSIYCAERDEATLLYTILSLRNFLL